MQSLLIIIPWGKIFVIAGLSLSIYSSLDYFKGKPFSKNDIAILMIGLISIISGIKMNEEPPISKNIINNNFPITIDSIIRDTVHDKQVLPKEETPILDMAIGTTPNPTIFKNENGKYETLYGIEGINDYIAYYPRNSLIDFLFKNGDVKYVSRFYRSFSNESSIVTNKSVVAYGYGVTFKRIPQIDTVYDYFRVYYKNKEGKEQKPLRKIFYYIGDGSAIPIFYEVDNDTYRAIKTSLISKNLW